MKNITQQTKVKNSINDIRQQNRVKESLFFHPILIIMKSIIPLLCLRLLLLDP